MARYNTEKREFGEDKLDFNESYMKRNKAK